MCKCLKISRSSYYYEVSSKPNETKLEATIQTAFHANRAVYGSRKIKKALFITIVFLLQMNHMLNGDLGYDRKNVCTLFPYQEYDDVKKLSLLLDKIENSSYISDITITNTPFLPITGYTRGERTYNDITLNVDFVNVKSNYFEVMNNKGASSFGKFPDAEMLDELRELSTENERCIVINETAAKCFGISDLSETVFITESNSFMRKNRVVGIVQDISHSPFSEVRPIIYFISELDDLYAYPILVYRYTDGNKKNAEEFLRAIADFDDNFPGFYDMENEYREYFRSEILLTKIIFSGTLISLLICGFGIYSILMLSCERRRKEIAIRKVNGAGRLEIIRLFISSYLIMSIVSLIFALPLGYILSEHWLSTYKVRIDQGFYIYLMTAFIVVGLIIVVCYDKLRRISGVSPARELRKG